jgi:hypothetical protein
MKTFTHSKDRLSITGLCIGDILTHKVSGEQFVIVKKERCPWKPCTDCRSEGYGLRCDSGALLNIYQCGTKRSLWKEIPNAK